MNSEAPPSNTITSPFIIGNIITDPNKFWGRKWECEEIFSRLSKMGSISITGPRRIGKSSLAYYIYKTGNLELGDDYELIWLDGQSNHSVSANHFFRTISNKSTLKYEPSENLSECLINFEDAVYAHSKKLVLFINEFEILTDDNHQDKFGIQFYNTLRLLAEHSNKCVIITISNLSLKELCKHVLGVSSPFYNIFEQKTLKHFTNDETQGFLEHHHNNIVMSPNEIQFIKENIKDCQHPLVLQIACDSILANRKNKLPNDNLKREIEDRVNYYLTHEEVKEGRRMAKQIADPGKASPKINKSLDLLISIMIPVFGIVILMVVYGLLIQKLSNFQAILLALVSAILGFAVLIFAGRSVDIIGESTFYKLFLQIIKQIPLLSSIAENIIQVATKLKGKHD